MAFNYKVDNWSFLSFFRGLFSLQFDWQSRIGKYLIKTNETGQNPTIYDLDGL